MKGNPLLGKTRIDQFHQGFHSLLLIGAVGNDPDGDATHNAKAQNAEKALCIDPSLLLLNPDGRLELVCLLDEECSRTGMEAYLRATVSMIRAWK